MTLTEIGTLAQIITPILILIASGIGWVIKRNFEEAQRREERFRDSEAKLRDERIKVYYSIIEPYILILSDDDNILSLPEYKKYKSKKLSKNEIAVEIMRSVNYKRAGLQLVWFGSDEVIKAFNRMMQYSYKNIDGQSDPKELFQHFGNFLLEIRRSVGNEITELNYFDMFEGFFRDADALAASDSN